MRIYLTQLGLAAPNDVDPDRPLSEQGREDVRRLADFLGSAGIEVEQVLHSGKLGVGLDDDRSCSLRLEAEGPVCVKHRSASGVTFLPLLVKARNRRDRAHDLLRLQRRLASRGERTT